MELVILLNVGIRCMFECCKELHPSQIFQASSPAWVVMCSLLEPHLRFIASSRGTGTMEAQFGGARKPRVRWTQKVALEISCF